MMLQSDTGVIDRNMSVFDDAYLEGAKCFLKFRADERRTAGILINHVLTKEYERK